MHNVRFEKEIEAISRDRTHGSTVLISRIIGTFLNNEPGSGEIRWALSRLKSIDPSMRVVHHFLEEVTPRANSDFGLCLRQYQDKWENIDQKLATKLTPLLPFPDLTLLLHSHSGMTIKVLQRLKASGFHPKLFQTESIPGGEGKVQAGELKKIGFSVQVISDKEVGENFYKLDACLLGVDHFDDRVFVNKTGSGEIVRFSEQFGIPVYLLADSRKKVPKTIVESDLFEPVPFRLNTHLLTE